MCRRLFFLVSGIVAVVMFWNLENYFDPFDDPVTLDDEFTAMGAKRWTWKRFERKRNGIAKVIVAAAAYGEMPAVAAFAEVENKMVLRQLLRETTLEKLDYDVIHRDSPDPRGIDVGMIYRKSCFKPLDVRSLRVSEEFNTRDILYVKGVLSADTVHLFVNHWPSKRGGAEVSGPRRKAAERVLVTAVDSIRAASPGQRIIALGDFNDTPENVSLPLHNLSLKAAGSGEGTLKYRGKWEMIDQCFVSDTAGCEMTIFRPPFLLEPDKTYTGVKPRRTYVGPKHNGGLSDHLPIVTVLRE